MTLRWTEEATGRVVALVSKTSLEVLGLLPLDCRFYLVEKVRAAELLSSQNTGGHSLLMRMQNASECSPVQ